MNKINLKGLTSEAITNIFILVLALVNAGLNIFGVNTLPIENEEISSIVSTAFLVLSALYNTYKNRNISTASQVAQQVTDAIKNGELLVDDVQALISKVKK